VYAFSHISTVYFQTDNRIVAWLGNMMALIVTLNRAEVVRFSTPRLGVSSVHTPYIPSYHFVLSSLLPSLSLVSLSSIHQVLQWLAQFDNP
jgi:hypothetical protein